MLENTELDVLQELINIGVGNAACTLNQMINSEISISIPSVKILKSYDLREINASTSKHNYVSMNFEGHYKGQAILAFDHVGSQNLVEVLLQEKIPNNDPDDLLISSLKEVGNITLNSLMGPIMNMLKGTLEYTLPEYITGFCPFKICQERSGLNGQILAAEVDFKGHDINFDGVLYLYFDLVSVGQLKNDLHDLYHKAG